MKESGEQVDDRIVEVYWETRANRWRMMRFRDDKPNGNFKTIVDNIIQSIIDGVEKEDVCLRPNFLSLSSDLFAHLSSVALATRYISS